jgi:multidrug efflux pump
MDPTRFALGKTHFVMMTIILLMLSGIGSYWTMSRAEDPGYIVRTAQVRTQMPGASPERVELLVTDKLEKVIQEMPEIDYITSESKAGESVITVEILESYKDMRPIWDSLRRKVETGEEDLPETAGKPIVNDEYGDIFGIAFGIIGDGFSYKEVKDIADDIRDELLRIRLIAKVDIYGIQDERIFIEYYNEKLAELGISPEQLGEILSQRNIINPGGSINLGEERIVVEPSGNFESVEEIANAYIEIPGTKQIIKLDSMADVRRDYVDPPLSKMRCNGDSCLGIAVSMREGGNIIQLGNEVNALLDRLQQNYPVGLEFKMVAYQPQRVDQKIKEFSSSLAQAIVVVTLVMLIFLGLRTGLIVASLVPAAVCISFLVMAFFNIGLDQVSLAALMIALGMLVDNSIVMAENILVQSQEGVPIHEAASRSGSELKIPLLISSLTTVAAFLPIYLAESSTGEYTAPIFQVVAITLLTSWVVALTMIPILCISYLKGGETKKEEKEEDPFANSPFYTKYRGFLLSLVRRPMFTMLVIFGIFLVSMYAMTYVPKLFFPPNETPMFTAEIDLPIGTPIELTEEVLAKIDGFIEKELVETEDRDGVTTWASFVGNGGPRYRLQHAPEPPSPYYAFTIFSTTNFEVVQSLIDRLESHLFENFPNVKSQIRMLENGSPVKDPIEIRISGKDEDTLFRLVREIKGAIESVSNTRNVADDWGLKVRKAFVVVDEVRAQRAGVSNTDVAFSLEAAFSGVTLTEYRENDDIIPVVLRSVVARDPMLISTESFNVYNGSSGESVPILQVADMELEWQTANVKRRNRLKTVAVTSDLSGGVTAASVMQALKPKLEEIQSSLPTGYFMEIGGESFESGKANESISEKLPIAGVVILLLLMAQFNNIKKVLIIIVTIPLAMIGVIAGLLITGSYFGFMTLLGIISLAGIVINNAIVLIDRIEIENAAGLPIQEAIIMAAQRRLRPILLTTITTMAGLFPLWMGGGMMWEPMAIAIIFGLFVSTILTLGVVPVLYTIFFRVKFDKESK